MEEILGLLIPLTFVAFLVLERVVPARPLPKVKRWLLKGFLFFVMTGAINAALPALVATRVGPYAPVSLAALGTVAGALVALLVAELVAYWVHRTLHRIPWLWRWTHQMHHSAERIDIAGAVYFHPFDITVQLLANVVAISLLGVSPDAAALAGFVGFSFALFQHLNVKTPRFIGWFIQRPEGHSIHHQRGLHAYNYGNIALWDQVFGTYRNPEGFADEAGFWDGASAEVGAMLIGRDVGERREPSRTSALVAEAVTE